MQELLYQVTQHTQSNQLKGIIVILSFITIFFLIGIICNIFTTNIIKGEK
jgi:hypothetical protein